MLVAWGFEILDLVGKWEAISGTPPNAGFVPANPREAEGLCG